MSRLEAFGNQLVEFHLWLRDQLDQLSDDVDEALHSPDAAVRPIARDLRTHCLTFCQALGAHHTGEDEGAFPVIAEHYPELRPVLEELARDHHLVTEALRRLETLDHHDPQYLRQELDTLAALLETHFTYEERKITEALNALTTSTPEDRAQLSRPFRRTGSD
ncbi:hemerythrin domain-containing protein [Kribbella sp. VKM Ac-2568]|uniref:hemerythrin domain-containing protein n=1 Tax=Kribbella sp. VKM Ac-2568 TaxID=2512219 RepID=UPI00104646FE|nr:hemerythrin domain-containing protein [Kribbella sp. VKM Ac-2568]TCM47819.1 hemerythrin HHE cation binding domain-containing protein [Kribbella sp. VKM Ac-2568]